MKPTLLHRASALWLAGALAACGGERPAAGTRDSTSARPAMVADPGVVPLDSSDFVVNGLSDQADTSAVKARFGRPDSITSESNPFSEGGKLYSWYYRDAVISLVNGDSGFIVLSMNLMGPRQATARGARVGDASDRLLTLYGEPTDRDDRAWMYEDPEQSLHQIVFLLRDGRITRIFLGTVLD